MMKSTYWAEHSTLEYPWFGGFPRGSLPLKLYVLLSAMRKDENQVQASFDSLTADNLCKRASIKTRSYALLSSRNAAAYRNNLIFVQSHLPAVYKVTQVGYCQLEAIWNEFKNGNRLTTLSGPAAPGEFPCSHKPWSLRWDQGLHASTYSGQTGWLWAMGMTWGKGNGKRDPFSFPLHVPPYMTKVTTCSNNFK